MCKLIILIHLMRRHLLTWTRDWIESLGSFITSMLNDPVIEIKMFLVFLLKKNPVETQKLSGHSCQVSESEGYLPAAPPSAFPRVEFTMCTLFITPRSSSVPLKQLLQIQNLK